MRLLRFYAFGAALWAASGCGSRTGLIILDELPDEPSEAGQDASDATIPDAGSDAPPDVAPDRAVDARADATADAEPDVTVDAVADAVVDVLPPIDVGRPRPVACEEGGPAATLIYVVTTQNDLWSFYPPSLAFSRIGHIDCPSTGTPFSMAVDQSGIAYVVYNDGNLFRVSTATAHCQATPFAVDQEEFQTFGMGYSQNPSGTGETLYVASDEDPDSGIPSRLGLIDTTAFALHTVGPFQPQLANAELTGTGAGDLFAFYALDSSPNASGGSGPPSAIGQIDKANGRLLGQTVLSSVAQGCAWAFAFWGGDFYEFVAPPGAGQTCGGLVFSVVWRYRPSDGTLVEIDKGFKETIVGAGVSTCAPQD